MEVVIAVIVLALFGIIGERIGYYCGYDQGFDDAIDAFENELKDLISE